jgi:hypothetical protein
MKYWARWVFDMALRNRKFYQGQATKGKYKSALHGKYYLTHPEKNIRG